MKKLTAIATATIVAASVLSSGVASAAEPASKNRSFEAQKIAMSALKGNKKQSGKGTTNWWDNERARRLARLEDFLEQNQEDFVSFRTAPLAIKQDPLNFVGIQMIIFRLLPEIFPDIWGPPEDKMAVVGFGPDPFDPESVMPLGQGYAPSATFDVTGVGSDLSVNYATDSCMGCHSGGVVGPDGELIRFVGGANQLGAFRDKVSQTVNDPRYTPETFRMALSEQPIGFIYGDPALLPQAILERGLFQAPGGAEFFLEELRVASNLGDERIADTLLAFTYDVPNPPLATGMPGSLDVFGLAGAFLCNPNATPPCNEEEVLPPAPAPADIPAAWQMIERPTFQWDNSVGNLVYREVDASLSVSAGDPAAVNIDNVITSGNFTEYLPSHPYPFDVSRPAAARGARIWRQACLGCHGPGNSILMTPEMTGTSPNRADVFTDSIVSGLIAQGREACTAPECFEPNGDEVPDSEILLATRAYGTTPLAGIWATGPYLHNGSVPTLYHLLTGDRPDSFYRGNFTYDEEFVGFTWDEATNPGLSLLYDTSLDGYSNSGHTGPEFNGGIDWKAEPWKLWDLLEYLKTL